MHETETRGREGLRLPAESLEGSENMSESMRPEGQPGGPGGDGFRRRRRRRGRRGGRRGPGDAPGAPGGDGGGEYVEGPGADAFASPSDGVSAPGGAPAGGEADPWSGAAPAPGGGGGRGPGGQQQGQHGRKRRNRRRGGPGGGPGTHPHHTHHHGGGGKGAHGGGPRHGHGQRGHAPRGPMPPQMAPLPRGFDGAVVAGAKPTEMKGLLELMPDGFGFVRAAKNSFLPSQSDPFVSQALIRRHEVREGSEVVVEVVPARREGQNPSALSILRVNGQDPDMCRRLPHFKDLTATDPDRRFRIAAEPNADVSLRIIDLLSPIGRGQRALIVAPPRTGKTILLQKLANAIEKHHPEAHVMMVLIDERPEEVTDMRRSIKGEVIASSYDQMAKGHVRLAEIVLKYARRLVETGKDVVVFLDSLTRMGRAYNLEIGHSGRTMSGGLDSRTMEKPREFFGSARCCEHGGSLTIIATALIDTGSRMDQVIFEEFKGTGNMELVLSRQLADRRIFPAIDINKTGTRKEEKLRTPNELQQCWTLRRVLNQLKPIEGMELLIDRLSKTSSNTEFLNRFDLTVRAEREE